MFVISLTADLQELCWEYSRWPIVQQVVRCRLTVPNEDRAEDHYLKQLSLMTRKLLYFTKNRFSRVEYFFSHFFFEFTLKQCYG